MKHFVESLFEWVKLDVGEQIFRFEQIDLNELTRNIIADWIPVLENSYFGYEIEIPETEYLIRMDPNAYTRILNNLLQNVITHSNGDKVALSVSRDREQTQIVVGDNGKGNGLGLSITKELVNAHKGIISAASTPGSGTMFTILFPKTP